MTIELRTDGEANWCTFLDELVAEGCRVHLERMADHWYCLIVEDGERRVMLNIGTAEKYQRKVSAKVYADEPATVDAAQEGGR